jgi:hypothetical protein
MEYNGFADEEVKIAGGKLLIGPGIATSAVEVA